MNLRRLMWGLAVAIVIIIVALREDLVPYPSKNEVLAENEAQPTNKIESLNEAQIIEQILFAIRSAEEIQDPFRRCISYPNPRNVQWTAETIEAFCNDAFAIYPTSSQIYRWIMDGDNLKAEDEFNRIIDGYFSGKLPEGTLRYSYNTNFLSSTEKVNRMTSDWLGLSPENAHALTARGLYLLQSGIEARGEKIRSKTSQKNKRRLNVYLRDAREHLEEAVRINNRIMPAYAGLITIARYLSDRKLAITTYEKGISIDKKNYHLRYAFIQLLQPRWGGSHDLMDVFVDNSDLFLKENPRLPKLRSMALASRAWHMYFLRGEVDHKLARSWLEKAIEDAPLVSALDSAAYTAARDFDDRLRAIELYSQILRFDPSNIQALKARAYSLTRLEQLEWALSECQKILTLEPNNSKVLADYVWLLEKSGDKQTAYEKLLQLYSLDSNNEWVAFKLAKWYLYNQRRFELAQPLVDQLIEADPENGAALLLHVDLLQNTGGSGLRKAIEQFIHYADSNNEEQRLALKKAKAWLKQN